ncbi:MAG: hypothetical protein K9N55_00500 [Phycisphaerae bacterium]|nr:hypothetical protein [Phycisphaerae bacterium]
MSDHNIIPPVSVDTSESLQQRNQRKQKDKKKRHGSTAHPRIEPKALKDQDITTSPDCDHLIDYEA